MFYKHHLIQERGCKCRTRRTDSFIFWPPCRASIMSLQQPIQRLIKLFICPPLCIQTDMQWLLCSRGKTPFGERLIFLNRTKRSLLLELVPLLWRQSSPPSWSSHQLSGMRGGGFWITTEAAAAATTIENRHTESLNSIDPQIKFIHQPHKLS